MMTLTGKIEQKGFGFGVWALVADGDRTYELKDPPAALEKSGIEVKITGKIREDMMTMANIGPVLEIESWEIIA